MSIKDELDRARKEKEAESKLKEDVWNKKREILTAMLDKSFTSLTKSINFQIDPLFNSLKSSEILKSLFDLRNECNLLYYTRGSDEPAGIIGRVLTDYSERKRSGDLRLDSYNLPVSGKPRDLLDSYRKFFINAAPLDVDYPEVNIENSAIDLSLLTDYKKGYSYRYRIDRINGAIDKRFDFNLISKAFQDSLPFIKSPKVERLMFEMTWDYHTIQDYDSGNTDVYSRIFIAVNSALISISRLNGLSASIASSKCTPSWVKQQIANVYVKHS